MGADLGMADHDVVEAGLLLGDEDDGADGRPRLAEHAHRLGEDPLLRGLGGGDEDAASDLEGVAERRDERARRLPRSRRSRDEDRPLLVERRLDRRDHVVLVGARLGEGELDLGASRPPLGAACGVPLVVAHELGEARADELAAGVALVAHRHRASLLRREGYEAEVELDLRGRSELVEAEGARSLLEEVAVELELARIVGVGALVESLERLGGREDGLHLLDHGPAPVVREDAVDPPDDDDAPALDVGLVAERPLAAVAGDGLLAGSLVALVGLAAHLGAFPHADGHGPGEAVVVRVRDVAHRESDGARRVVEADHGSSLM